LLKSSATAATVLTLVVVRTLSAYAQPYEHYRTNHWVYDDRFHHGHYYPRVGYTVRVLPPGYAVVNYRSAPYYYHAGVWYRPSGPGFVVVAPPIGIIVPLLPPAYATVYAGGVPYYYANEVYYQQVPNGYAVVNPPVNYVEGPPAPMAQGPPAMPPPMAQGPPAPPPQASTAQAGVWYYCESAKGYYPYVRECKEGWRSVPAAPPPPN